MDGIHLHLHQQLSYISIRLLMYGNSTSDADYGCACACSSQVVPGHMCAGIDMIDFDQDVHIVLPLLSHSLSLPPRVSA